MFVVNILLLVSSKIKEILASNKDKLFWLGIKKTEEKWKYTSNGQEVDFN